MMSFMDVMTWPFSSKSKTSSYYPKLRVLEQPHQVKAREFQTGLIDQDIDYPRRRIAPMSAGEQKGQSILGEILAGKAFADPSTSPAYLGFRRESKRATEEGASAMRHRQNLGGMFRSGPGGRQESDFRSRMADQEMSYLGQLYEMERARDNPYTRLMASAQYGGLPRQIEQQGMDASYNEASSELLAPYQLQSPIANSLLQYAPWQSKKYYSTPSEFTQFMSDMGPLIQAGGMAMMSDMRLKDNIRYVNGPWATWTWKPEAAQFGLSGNSCGLVAQDVLSFAPHAVLRHPSGYLMINYAVI